MCGNTLVCFGASSSREAAAGSRRERAPLRIRPARADRPARRPEREASARIAGPHTATAMKLLNNISIPQTGALLFKHMGCSLLGLQPYPLHGRKLFPAWGQSSLTTAFIQWIAAEA